MTKLIATLTFLCFCVAGCHFKRMTYRYFDWYVEHKLNSYFDLTKSQETLAENLVDDALTQINKVILPLVAADLRTLAMRGADGSFSPTDTEWLLERYFHYRTQLYVLIAPYLAELLETISPEQINYLKAALAKENKEAEEKLALPPDEYEKKELKAFYERFNRFYGSLSREQEAQIATILDMKPSYGQKRFQVRLQMQTSFVSMLQKKLDRKAIAEQIGAWAKSPRLMIQDKELKEWDDRKWEGMRKKITAIDALITAEQRKSMEHELMSLSEDLGSMSTVVFK